MGRKISAPIFERHRRQRRNCTATANFFERRKHAEHYNCSKRSILFYQWVKNCFELYLIFEWKKIHL